MGSPAPPCWNLPSARQAAREVFVLILEYKLRVNHHQRAAIDEAIRTTQFIRNKCLRLWMETRGTGEAALQAYCAQLDQDFSCVWWLNSMARQANAVSAWFLISRFY